MPNKKPGKFDKQKYDNKFHEEHYSRQYIRFNNEKDADVIEKLNSVPNKADYIRQLVRKDIANEKQS